MFWNKKPNPAPLGVPLGDLMAMLAPTTIKTSLKGDALIAQHEHYAMRIEVVPPATRESENGPIRAVVRMITELPAFRSHDFARACKQLGIVHKFTRAYRPQTNGKAERFIQSALDASQLERSAPPTGRRLRKQVSQRGFSGAARFNFPARAVSAADRRNPQRPSEARPVHRDNSSTYA
jgi:hypothetical protein